MSIKIAYPDIPLRASRTRSSESWGDSIKRQQLENNISGQRANLSSLTTSKTGRTVISHQVTSSTVDHFIIGRADKIGASAAIVRTANASALAPNDISGLVAWFDANTGTTINSSNGVNPWVDRYAGISATQATTANYPILSRYDNKENTLTYSEIMLNVAWDKTSYPCSVIDNDTTNYLGASTAARVTATAGNSRHGAVWTGAGVRFLKVNANSTWKVSVDAKAGTANYIWVGSSADSPWHGVSINLSNGTFNGNGGNVTDKTITSLGSSWYRIELIFTATASHFPDLGVWLANAANDTSPPSVVAAGTETYYITRPQIQRASTDTDYLTTTAAPQFAGINGNRVIHFDGTNDYLTADSIAATFTGSDKPISIFISYKADVASTASLVSLGRSASANPYMVWRQDGSYTYITRDDTGTTKNQSTGSPGLTTKIWSHINTGTTATDYIDGSQIGSAGYDVDLTARTLDRFSMGVLGRNTYTDYYSGSLGDVIIYNRALTTDERQTIEAYLTAKYSTNPIVADYALAANNGNDYISTFNTSSAATHFWVEFDSATSNKLAHSKIFLGNWLDFGETIEDIQVVKMYSSSEYSISDMGNEKLSRIEAPRYQIAIEWTGLTDSQVMNFYENIVKKSTLINGFYLYSGTNTDQLNGKSLIYCRLVESAQPERIKVNYNTLRVVFEEYLG